MPSLSEAGCGGTVRTWDAGAGNNRWSTNNNWDPNDQPNTASEDALIVSASRPTAIRNDTTIGCLEVQSGQFKSRNSRTLSITGDYFRSHTLGGLNIVSTHTKISSKL